MPNILFTSDTHFDHEKIIEYCNRPFNSVEEMNETMIQRWNERVKPGDTVYHLGDFGYKTTTAKLTAIRKRLNGDLCLVEGNHDIYGNFGWVWRQTAHELARLDDLKKKIVLYHYGQRTWRHDIRGAWHLFGHSHGGLPPYGKSFDVGVDVWDFYPVDFDQVSEKMATLEIGDHPMFSNFKQELENASR